MEFTFGYFFNNLAIRGLCHAYKNRGRHIITTPVEHASVHETIHE